MVPGYVIGLTDGGHGVVMMVVIPDMVWYTLHNTHAHVYTVYV